MGLSENTEVKIENNSILSSGYGLIPRTIMRDKSISIGAKGLYSYLASFAGSKLVCYPTRDTIMDELKIAKNTFNKYLKELQENGYIIIERNRSNNGTLTNNIYHLIHDKRVVDNSKPRLKNCDMDNQPSTKNCDMDKNIGNTESEPRLKNCDMDESVENTTNLTMSQNLTAPCLKICDTNSNNININSKYVYKDEENKTVDNSISEFKKLYEQNIGVIYPIKAEWLIELSKEIDIQLFKRAIEICAENTNMSHAYLNGILNKWRDKNITTYEQLKTYELGIRNKQEAKEKKTTKESSYRPKKNKFHNFDESFNQYSADELDEIIRKSQKAKFG